MLSEEEFAKGIRQACQSTVVTDLVVTVLNESRLEKAIQAREKKEFAGISAVGWRFDPPLKKYFLELPPPSLADNISDMSRVMRGLRQSYNLTDLSIDYEVVRTLPEIVREDNWRITVTTLQEPVKPNSVISPVPRINRIESGDTRDKHVALAIDIGTTTVCSQLLDLNRGKILAESIVFNKQIHYGLDVIARIAFIQKPGISGLKKLQDAVTESINQTIDDLLAQSHIHRRDIGHINIAGNTTMTQILFGLNPKYIRLSPYVPAAKFLPPVKAQTLA
jgi:uncharacterized 2Fe-2S/4Fe-4S cluster protein (DUF4445 family)